jgi:hypothetical protein
MLPADLGAGERLYLCGNWPEIGGAAVGGLAWFDGQNFGAWGTGAGVLVWGGFNPFVESLEKWNDGNSDAIYACGRFLGIDNASTTNVARYDIAEGKWEAFGQALIPTSSVNNMTSWALFDDGSGEALYVGGQGFRISGNPNVYLVAKWDGNNWTGVGQTLSGRVTDLDVWDDGDGPALYLSGTATFEVNYFAKLVDNTWVPAASGVNNPAVDGGFASAFGLHVWNGALLVGGNFSRVGGFDEVTGVGEGDPIPARGLAALMPCVDRIVADSYQVFRGFYVSGGLADTFESDDAYLKFNPGIVLFSTDAPVWLIFDGTLPGDSSSLLSVALEASANTPGLTQTVEMFNWQAAAYEVVGSQSTGLNDTHQLIDVSGNSDFVEPVTGAVRTRIGWRPSGIVFLFPWTVCIDQVNWFVQ